MAKLNVVGIADPDTAIALRFAGIKTREANRETQRKVFRETYSDKSVGIVLITRTLAEEMRDEVDYQRFNNLFPIIMEIPSAMEEAKGDYLLKMIKKTIGIELEGIDA
jgi:vacuolar-type H+-ATPase subunit F/Vma7